MSWLLIILGIIYALSVFAVWNYCRINYSKIGKERNSNASLADFFIMICPIVNTLLAIIAWSSESPYADETKISHKWLNILFGVKK